MYAIRSYYEGTVTVYADATIAFPILALYVLSNQKSRKPKRLYKKLSEYYNNLSKDYFDKPRITSYNVCYTKLLRDYIKKS